jgi:hypothetical protein
MAKKPYIIAFEEHYQDPEVKQLGAGPGAGREVVERLSMICWIIEDDYKSEFRQPGGALPPLRGGRHRYVPCAINAVGRVATKNAGLPCLVPALLVTFRPAPLKVRFATDSPLEEAGFELSVPPERKAFARVLAALIHASADSEAQIIGQAADSKSPFGFQRRNRQHGAVRRSAPVFGQARRTP